MLVEQIVIRNEPRMRDRELMFEVPELLPVRPCRELARQQGQTFIKLTRHDAQGLHQTVTHNFGGRRKLVQLEFVFQLRNALPGQFELPAEFILSPTVIPDLANINRALLASEVSLRDRLEISAGNRNVRS